MPFSYLFDPSRPDWAGQLLEHWYTLSTRDALFISINVIRGGLSQKGQLGRIWQIKKTGTPRESEIKGGGEVKFA